MHELSLLWFYNENCANVIALDYPAAAMISANDSPSL